MKKPGAPKGSRNAAKASTRSAHIHVKCTGAEKVTWKAAAQMSRKSLSALVVGVMNAEADKLCTQGFEPYGGHSENPGSDHLSIRVLPEEKAAWQNLAGSNGESLSQCVKRLLNEKAKSMLAINKG